MSEAKGFQWQCAIFDLDGTLVDSESLNCQAYNDLIPEVTEPASALVERYGGMQFAAILRDIETRYGIKLPTDFETSFREHVRTLYAAGLKAIPGIPELLSALQEADVPCCVASNAPDKKIVHALALTGLSGFFWPEYI